MGIASKSGSFRPSVVLFGSYDESLVRFRGELIRDILRRGYALNAIAPKENEYVQDWIAETGASFIPVPLNRTALNPLSDLQLLFGLSRLFIRLRPACTISYTIKPVVWGMLAAAAARVPVRVAMVTGLGYGFSDSAGWVGKVVRLLYRTALTFSTHVFFQNPDNMQVFIDLGLVKASKCYLMNGSGVDVCEYPLTPLPEEMSFLFIGRLIADKGVREFFQAARLLKQEYPAVSFHVAGWIDDNPTAISEAELQSVIEDGVIEYHGKLSDVRPVIASSSVFVLPSYHEGTPRTVLEAMSMGRPVITTDAPGCRETVVSGENGLLVPVADVDALVHAMKHMLDHPEKLPVYAEKARHMAEEKYDVKQVNARFLEDIQLKNLVEPKSG